MSVSVLFGGCVMQLKGSKTWAGIDYESEHTKTVVRGDGVKVVKARRDENEPRFHPSALGRPEYNDLPVARAK